MPPTSGLTFSGTQRRSPKYLGEPIRATYRTPKPCGLILVSISRRPKSWELRYRPSWSGARLPLLNNALGCISACGTLADFGQSSLAFATFRFMLVAGAILVILLSRIVN